MVPNRVEKRTQAGEARRVRLRLILKCLLAVSLLAVLLGALWLSPGGGPTYKRHSAGYWLERMNGEPVHDWEPRAAFHQMGTNAVPFLIKTLERKPSKLEKFLDNHLLNGGSIEYVARALSLPSAARVERDRLNAQSFICGSRSSMAIPVLVTIITTPS